MIEGKTSKGFAFSLEDDALDNWEILELIKEMDAGNTAILPDLIHLLLGDDQVKALKEFVRKPNGVVRISDMSEALVDIFASAKDLKK